MALRTAVLPLPLVPEMKTMFGLQRNEKGLEIQVNHST